MSNLKFITTKKDDSSFFHSKKTLIMKKNKIIYEKGQELKFIYIILDGIVESFSSEKKSKNNITLKKGSSLGLMDLILSRNYTKTMISKKTSILAVINKNTIFDLLKPDDFKSILLKSLAIDVDNNSPNMWS